MVRAFMLHGIIFLGYEYTMSMLDAEPLTAVAGSSSVGALAMEVESGLRSADELMTMQMHGHGRVELQLPIISE